MQKEVRNVLLAAFLYIYIQGHIVLLNMFLDVVIENDFQSCLLCKFSCCLLFPVLVFFDDGLIDDELLFPLSNIFTQIQS